MGMNDYGDKMIQTPGGYGSDISSQRIDALDQASLDFIEQQQDVIGAIDLGGGLGRHSVRMAAKGADVTLVELSNPVNSVHDFCKEDKVDPDKVRVLGKDYRDLSPSDYPQNYKLLYSQRSLCHVPYHDALNVLKAQFNALAEGGKIFISSAGYDTEDGKSHTLRDKPVHERFGYVSEEMQKKYGLTAPLLPYRADEFGDLAEAAGFQVEKIFVSDFGNIKLIGYK